MTTNDSQLIKQMVTILHVLQQATKNFVSRQIGATVGKAIEKNCGEDGSCVGLCPDRKMRVPESQKVTRDEGMEGRNINTKKGTISHNLHVVRKQVAMSARR
jgi:hypothetical protein